MRETKMCHQVLSASRKAKSLDLKSMYFSTGTPPYSDTRLMRAVGEAKGDVS